MIEGTVLDYIHHYINLSDEDLGKLQNEFAERELTRLTHISHLGLVSKIRRLARHDKLEHAYGTYWLCKQCVDRCHALISKKEEFPLAGLMHGIGHLPFSYDTEYAIGKLYEIHEPTRAWLNSVFDRCVRFAQHPNVEQTAKDMQADMDYSMLHRWFAVYKMAESSENDFSGQLGINIARILLDPQCVEYNLLGELDKIDYVLRDMHHLAFGRIELNLLPLLAEFRKGPEGQLESPDVLKLIDTTRDWLCDRAYLDPDQKCLSQVVEKCIVREVLEDYLNPNELLGMTDEQFERRLSRFHFGGVSLEEVVVKIKSRRLVEVTRVVCDPQGKSIVGMEKLLAGTNIAGIHKYPQTKGTYIQCIPNPYCTDAPAYEFTESGLTICVAYDFESGCPENVIDTLLRTEYWAPSNPYGIRMSCREDALRFLLGQQVQPHFERYDDMRDIVRRHIPEDRFGPNLFDKSWGLREEAVEHLLYEYDYDWPPTKHFIQYPEHWSTRIVRNVANEVEQVRTRPRRRRNESESDYEDRKDKLLEYLTYLRTVLRIRREAKIGWVLPSVWILKENGEKEDEVDVIAAYLPLPRRRPATIELLEVSNNDSQENQVRNKRKLNKIAQRIRRRFGRKVRIVGYFNNREVVA